MPLLHAKLRDLVEKTSELFRTAEEPTRIGSLTWLFMMAKPVPFKLNVIGGIVVTLSLAWLLD